MKDKVDLTKILQVNLVGVVIFVALGVLAGLLMNQSSYQVITNYWTSNSLASQTSAVFAPTSRVLFGFQVRWAVVALMVLSVIVPLLYIYLIKSKQKEIDLQKYRYIDWAITSALIVILIAVLSGAQNIMTLVLVGSLVVLGYAFRWLAVYNKTITFKANVLAIICQVLPWILVAVYAISTLAYGMVRSPWYVYALYLLGIVKLVVMISVYFGDHSGDKNGSQTNKILHSNVDNIAFKFFFALILIIGLSR